MKADSEGRWKEEEKISRLSHTLSSFFQVDICGSDSAEEMDQKHSKFGAKPKWCAHADRPIPCGEDPSASSIPPWRGPVSHSGGSPKTTVEGLSEQPRCGVKQQYEALLRKHAIEHTKLMEEYEEMNAAGNGKMKTSRRKRKDGRRRLRRSFFS